MSKDYISPDTPNRERTNADRRAFVLSENSKAMFSEIQNRTKPAEPESTLPLMQSVSARTKAFRESTNLRKQRACDELAVFAQVLGETVYRALPFDNLDKQDIQQSVIEKTVEYVTCFSEEWKPTSGGTSLIEAVREAIVEAKDLAEMKTLVEAEINKSGSEINILVESISCEIEERVIAAAAANKARSEQLECRVRHLTEGVDGDLAEARRRRELKRVPPTLLETMYTLTCKELGDSKEEIPAEVIMAEAVTTYTLVETMSAVGIISDISNAPDFIRQLKAKSL